LKFVEKYTTFLKKYKIIVIIIWAIVLGFSIWLAPRFIAETSSDFNVPEDTPSHVANTILLEEFPEVNTQTSIVLVIQNENSSLSVLTSDIAYFCIDFNTSLRSSEYVSHISDIRGYYYMINTSLSIAAMGFVSETNTTTIVEISVFSMSDTELNDFVEYAYETIDFFKPDKYVMLLTGSHILFEDMKNASEKDIIVMDAIVLPIALIVLAIVLKSFKLMILPIVSVGFSIATSFFLMYPVAAAMPVFSFVPV